MRRKAESSKQNSEKSKRPERLPRKADHDYTDKEVAAFEGGPRVEIDYMAKFGRPRNKGERRFEGNRLWWPIVGRARQIAEQHTDIGIGLRQLHYRLLSETKWGYENTPEDYDYLSKKTAEARRAGRFPTLIDAGRSIEGLRGFDSPEEFKRVMFKRYRRNRVKGQECVPWVAVEKGTFAALFESWFDDLGLPRVFCGGYSSQSYLDVISETVASETRAGRGAVLLYGGDYDASGHDIRRHITTGTTGWKRIVELALNAEQVREFNLALLPGKDKDPRAGKFMEAEGLDRNVQVELDAVPPLLLRALYDAVIAHLIDFEQWVAVVVQEQEERVGLMREIDRDYDEVPVEEQDWFIEIMRRMGYQQVDPES